MTAAARAPIAAGLALAGLMFAAPSARAAGGDIDDPKMARRLGSRVDSASGTDTTAAGAPATAAPASSAALASPAAPRTAGDTPSADLVAASSGGGVAASGTPAVGPGGRTPLVGLGYRRFSFVQLGATDPSSATGAASSEPFDTLSLDFYPISHMVRFGLSTQYGWQSGRFNAGGDYFIAQSVSLGLQAPGTTVTPFAEAFAGGGYLRRAQFDRTIPTAYWQFGIDGGASFFVADRGYFSVALGYLRPVNGFLKMQSFTSVYVDTWSLKIGFGI